MTAIEVSDEQFAALIADALDTLPQEYVRRMLPHVAVLYADEPSPEQRRQNNVRPGETLLGLYEGVALTRRQGRAESKLTPDKITLFKGPLAARARTIGELREQVRHTLWHEMAHYFGLDHEAIRVRDGES